MNAIAETVKWADRDALLEYMLAGRRIGRVTFKARVCATPWSTLPSIPADQEAVAQLSDRSVVQLFSHPVASHLTRLTTIDGAIRYVTRHYHRCTVKTTGAFDDYLRSLSPKTRQTIKRKVRRYCNYVGADDPWRRATTVDELRAFHKLARPISVRSYQERLLGVGLPSWAGLMEMLREADGMRAFLLLHESVAVAFLLTPIYGGTALYTFVGHDPAYAAWSPGTVLQYFALRSMFEDADVEQLDFAEGPGQHKACFATSGTLCADVYYFRRNVRAVAAIGAHVLVNLVDRAAARALDWLHVKSKVRQLLRFARPGSRSWFNLLSGSPIDASTGATERQPEREVAEEPRVAASRL